MPRHKPASGITTEHQAEQRPRNTRQIATSRRILSREFFVFGPSLFHSHTAPCFYECLLLLLFILQRNDFRCLCSQHLCDAAAEEQPGAASFLNKEPGFYTEFDKGRAWKEITRNNKKTPTDLICFQGLFSLKKQPNKQKPHDNKRQTNQTKQIYMST